MRPLARSLVSAAIASILASTTATAQSQSPRETRGAPAGQFDFYVLALSWSPGFCEASGSVKGRSQCDTGARLGFVVHGLWPQNESGYPSFCEPGSRSAPRGAMEEALGVFPDQDLARLQWRKHGSCTGASPSQYFRDVRRARELVRVPDRLMAPAEDARVLAHEIERAFSEANPGLRPEMMAVECGRRIFQEIRICLDKDLRGFRACPEVDRDGCRAGVITVPSVR